MTSASAVLYRQETEFTEHLSKHGYQYLAGKSSPSDLCRLRTRESDNLKIEPDHQLIFDGEVFSETNSNFRKTKQETIDVECGRDPKGDWIGGPFASHLVEQNREPSTWYTQSPVLRPGFLRPPDYQWVRDRYTPPFLSNPPSKLLRLYNPLELGADPSSMDVAITQALGKLAGARNNARPDSTYADFAQSIAELREVSQLVNLRSKRLINIVGSAVLSVEFGWKPIISDVQKILNLSSSLKKRLLFLKRNAGKPVKRKRTLFNYTESHGQVSELTFGKPNPFHTVLPKEGVVPVYGSSVHTATYHSVQTYDFHDDPDTTGWDSQAASHLAGLSLDPTLLWELAPYSWLVDWITNIGDLVESRWKTQLVDSSIQEEWITITSEFYQSASVPTVAGKGEDVVVHTDALTERRDTFKLRLIPPTVAPLEIINLISFDDRQQAILASLFAAKYR